MKTPRINTRLAAIAAVFASLTLALDAQVPQLINYQGRVAVGTVNFNGPGLFKFAFVNAAGTVIWTNSPDTNADGVPDSPVTRAVSGGAYSVLLGDTTLANMTAIPLSVFENPDVSLRVWFDDGIRGSQLLTPDQRIAAVGYAMMAANIQDGAITSAKIASGAVGGIQLASGLTLGGITIGTFSGNLAGNATTATSATTAVSAVGFTGSLLGDVTGNQGATVVSNIAGLTAANVATGANRANTATNTNAPGTIVLRDASGNFSAGTITGNLIGNATGFSGSLVGDVTGTQSGTAISSTTVTGKLLTGFVSAAGPVSASDSILTAFNKLNGNDALKAPLASPAFTGTILLPAGSATAAPLRLQSGANLTTPVFGAVEFDGTSLYVTNNNATPTRKTIAFTDSTITGSQLAPNLTLGGITVGTFSGNGGALTNLSAANLTAGGTLPALNGAALTSLSASNISAGTLADARLSGNVVLTTLAQTLTNKTLTTPVISAISNTGTLTLPTVTDTLVGRTTSDTLTNKTLIDATSSFADDLDNTKKVQLQLSGITTAMTRTLTVPDASTTLVGTDTTQTLTNKTITGTFTGNGSGLTGLTAANLAGTITGSQLASNLTLGGTTIGSFSGNGSALTNLSAANLTAGGTLPALNGAALTSLNASNISTGTLADARLSGNVVMSGLTQMLTNKTLIDATSSFADDLDNTKKVQLQLSGLTTATTRTLTVPDASMTLVGTDTTQTLTNKTITGTFTGNGSGLTGVTAANLAGTITGAQIASNTIVDANIGAGIAATKLGTGVVDNTELGFLDGVSAPIQTQLGTLSTAVGGKVNRAGDTMTGTLTLPANGLSVGGTQLVAGSGNVGIGTASPQWPLDVNGSIHVGSYSADGTPKLIHFGDIGYVSIGENTADDRMELTATQFVFNNGSVGIGIGTATPSAKLDVAGTVKATTFIGDGSQLTGISSSSGASLTLSGNLNLPYTSSSSAGVITLSGTRVIHSFGGSNFFAGHAAGNFTMTGNFNVGCGPYALYSNSTGDYNTACGHYALSFNTTGAGNTASGFQALSTNTTGNYNTASGNYALYTNTAGDANTAVGHYALRANTTGSNNIAVGNLAGDFLTTGNNNIDIGNRGVAAEAATIRLGTSGTQTRAFVAGIRGITTGTANAIPVVIDGNGQLGTVSSSRRYKEDIADMGAASARLQALRPVTFRYKQPYANGEKPVQYGLIAEEVAEAFPELAVLNDEGQPETVKYQDLTPLLLNEVQKLRAEKDELKRESADRKKESAELRARLEKLEALILKGAAQ